MLQPVKVVCYSGYRAGEKPLRFTCGNNEYGIEKILDRSVEESFPGRARVYRFRVLCSNGETFSLVFDPREDQWYA